MNSNTETIQQVKDRLEAEESKPKTQVEKWREEKKPASSLKEDMKKVVEDVKKFGKVEGDALIIDDGIQKQKIGEIKEIWNQEKINILDRSVNKKLRSWKDVKLKMSKLFSSDGLIFISHKEDSIVGKPERIDEVKKKVVLITKAGKRNPKTQAFEEKYLFLDDSYNRRDDGNEQETMGLHFWTYRIVENAIEYIVLSEKELDPQQHILRGMKIDLKDSSEFTKTLKIRSISNLFLCVENEPSIKPMPKEELIEFVKNLNITKEEFVEYLHTHPNGKVYSHTENFSGLKNGIRKASRLFKFMDNLRKWLKVKKYKCPCPYI